MMISLQDMISLVLSMRNSKSPTRSFECSLNENVPSNTLSSHDGSTCVVKVDASTSCHDLLTMPCTSSCDNMSTLGANLLKENEKLKIDNAKLVDGLERCTKGYEKTNEMMIHQALSGDFKGFNEAIKKHKVDKKKKPLKAPLEKMVYNC